MSNRITEHINELPDEEEKKYMAGWYAEDINRLDLFFPKILRRSLFVTLMSQTEVNLLRACKGCKRAFKLQKEFKKKGDDRVINQALSYLKSHLSINDRNFKADWGFVQKLWTIRNALVHNDGIPRKNDVDEIRKFSDRIPSLDFDHQNHIILKEGFVQLAFHYVNNFFILLKSEINSNV